MQDFRRIASNITRKGYGFSQPGQSTQCGKDEINEQNQHTVKGYRSGFPFGYGHVFHNRDVLD